MNVISYVFYEWHKEKCQIIAIQFVKRIQNGVQDGLSEVISSEMI